MTKTKSQARMGRSSQAQASQQSKIPKILPTEKNPIMIQFGKSHPEHTQAMVDKIIFQYLRFMHLKIDHPDKLFAPSPLVDAMWHAHILSTKEYFAFCARHNRGNFIHHDPTLGYGDQRYQETLKEYQQKFNQNQDKLVWGDGPHPFYKKFKANMPQGYAAQINAEVDDDDEEEDDKKPPAETRSAAIKTETDGQGSARRRSDSKEDEPLPKRKRPDPAVSSIEQGNIVKQEGGVSIKQESDKSEDDREEAEYEDVEEEDEGEIEEEPEIDWDDGKGATEEERIEWHRKWDMEDNHEADGFEKGSYGNCWNVCSWYNGGYDIHCAGCRESSEGIGSFSCG
jgi:hypothetical protein